MNILNLTWTNCRPIDWMTALEWTTFLCILLRRKSVFSMIVKTQQGHWLLVCRRMHQPCVEWVMCFISYFNWDQSCIICMIIFNYKLDWWNVNSQAHFRAFPTQVHWNTYTIRHIYYRTIQCCSTREQGLGLSDCFRMNYFLVII